MGNRKPLESANRGGAIGYAWVRSGAVLRVGWQGAAVVACAALLAACHFMPSPPPRSEALRGQALGRVVDSVVVLPFSRETTVQINEVDLNQFRDQLEAQIVAKKGIKAYPKPPTTLPNTIILAGTLVAFEVHEQTSEGMFLRTIDMIVKVDVTVGGDKSPALKLEQPYSFQRLYLTPQGAATLEYDLHNAAKEATGTLAAILVPGKQDAPMLQSATDSVTGANYSHALLVRGNREAGFGRFDNAITAWSLLLYNPSFPDAEPRYRVSERTLARLTLVSAPQRTVDALKPLTRQSAESLEDLRDAVIKVLGPNSPLEPTVLQLSDETSDRIQINLARAHYNLASVYLTQKRFDVAAYHLSRAYGYDPMPSYMQLWVATQANRLLIPKEAPGQAAAASTWIRAYQRVPAPFTATVSGGPYERNLMAPPAFVSAGPPARPVPAPLTVPVPTDLPGPAVSPAKTPTAPATPGQPPRPYGQPTTPSRQSPRPAQRLGY